MTIIDYSTYSAKSLMEAKRSIDKEAYPENYQALMAEIESRGEALKDENAFEEENALKGIGGWLILPILGLIILPVRILIALYNDYLPLFREGYWAVLTTPGTEVYHQLWAPYIMFELISNMIFCIACIYLLYLIFTKSHLLPKLIIIFYIANLIVVVFNYYLGTMIPFVADQVVDEEVFKEIARAVVGVLIWVPYFILSKRVQNTFVKKE